MITILYYVEHRESTRRKYSLKSQINSICGNVWTKFMYKKLDKSSCLKIKFHVITKNKSNNRARIFLFNKQNIDYDTRLI